MTSRGVDAAELGVMDVAATALPLIAKAAERFVDIGDWRCRAGMTIGPWLHADIVEALDQQLIERR
jgi:hypothetical protein